MNNPTLPPIRPPRLAEMVASALRTQILDGDLADGSELPSQERLLAEFGVPKQALREGLRILEFENLITVRRGNVGGAIVHAPTPRGASYGLGLVLQARHVKLSELGAGLNLLEPLCARLCAQRLDRAESVIPELRRIHDESVSSLSDIEPFTDAMSRFHRTIVTSCGNETLAVVAGAVEEVWLAQVHEWSVQQAAAGRFPDLEYRRQGVAAHARLIELIAAGDARGAAELAEDHFDPSQFYTESIQPGHTVHVSAQRGLPGEPLRPG